LAYDGVADSLDVCDGIINPTDLSGKIAVVRRGNCSFTSKVLACQNAGAIGVIVVNNLGAAAGMGGSSASVTIPSVMVASWDGQDKIATEIWITVLSSMNMPTESVTG
jgi:extracellular elastinolytic metalloproteinase